MATKTMILRPSYFVDASSDCELTPSDTTLENSYLLINEENYDDDSTIIRFGSGYIDTESGFYKYGFNYSSMGKPSSFKLSFRVTGGTSITSIVYIISIEDTNHTIIKSLQQTIPVDNINGKYVTFTEEIPISSIQELSNIQNGYIQIELRAYTSTRKSNSFNLTQSYIELEYEENLDKYYIKHNNTWILLSDVFYKKVIDSWILTEPSILSEELKYLNNYIE